MRLTLKNASAKKLKVKFYRLNRSFAHLLGLLLELLDSSLVDTSALIDQVTSGGRLAGVDVADNDDVDVSLFFTHGEKFSI